jgi:hypothetical protein
VLRTLAITLAAAAFVAAGCGGGRSAPGIGESNNTNVCAFSKRTGSAGTVYIEMAVSPKSLEPKACGAFNARFRGREIPMNGKLGTGHAYCRYNDRTATSFLEIGAFASSEATGTAFCRTFHPGDGFKRVQRRG